MNPTPNKTLIILAFFSIYVIWGSTYLLNKIAVDQLPPFMLASARFLTAGVLIFIIAKVMRIPLGISKLQLRNTVIVGFLFLTFGNGVVVWALKYVDSGFAALEISAQPLVILLLMWLLQGKKIKAMSMIGVVLGIIGIYLLVSQKELLTKEGSLIGMLMIFACMLMIASLLFGETWIAPSEWSTDVSISMLLLVLFGSIVAFTSFNYLLKAA